MAAPAIIGAGIAGGTALFNAFSQGKQNKKQRQWNEKMYNLQREHSLQDWNMQNEYNSPQSQMARLQEAGINPASVAGTGAEAASPVQQAHMQPFKPTAPVIDLPNIVDGYFDMKMKQASIDNMKQQGNILALDAVSKAQQNKFFDETFNYRRLAEKHKSNSLYEDVVSKAANYIANTGFQSPNLVGGTDDFSKESRYSLQMQGMKLANELRSKESRSKDVDYDINKIRRDYQQRTLGGDLSNLTWQDWLKMALQQIKPR